MGWLQATGVCVMGWLWLQEADPFANVGVRGLAPTGEDVFVSRDSLHKSNRVMGALGQNRDGVIDEAEFIRVWPGPRRAAIRRQGRAGQGRAAFEILTALCSCGSVWHSRAVTRPSPEHVS